MEQQTKDKIKYCLDILEYKEETCKDLLNRSKQQHKETNKITEDLYTQDRFNSEIISRLEFIGYSEQDIITDIKLTLLNIKELKGLINTVLIKNDG